MNPVLLVQAAELITPDRIASELHRLTPEGRESFLTLTVPGFPAYEEPPAPAPSKIVIPMRTVLPKRPGYKAPAEGSVNVSDLPSPSFSSFQPVRKGNPYYSYIDPSIAIGDHRSSYDGFNVVVNLNYPFNGAERHAVMATVEKEQLVINVGIEDNPTEPMLDLLQKIVPYLLDLRSRNVPLLRRHLPQFVARHRLLRQAGGNESRSHAHDRHDAPAAGPAQPGVHGRPCRLPPKVSINDTESVICVSVCAALPRVLLSYRCLPILPDPYRCLPILPDPYRCPPAPCHWTPRPPYVSRVPP